MSVTLAGIVLPDDLVWIDEFDWEPVAQAGSRAIGGTLFLEESALLDGQPMTLGTSDKGGQWVSRSTLITLRALAAGPDATHTLSLRGTDYTVVFRRPAISARPVFEVADPDPDDPYAIVINLLRTA